MHVRKLALEDKEDFLYLLSELTPDVGHHTDTSWKELFSVISNDSTQHCLVAVIGKTVVGTATGTIQQKFIHSGGRAGSIQDVVVHPDHRQKGVCKKLLNELDVFFKSMQCYKVEIICNHWARQIYKSSGYQLPREDVALRKMYTVVK